MQSQDHKKASACHFDITVQLLLKVSYTIAAKRQVKSRQNSSRENPRLVEIGDVHYTSAM